ncbi:hypothetical protein [Streptomyces mirabilis]|uniref:hypothetical protein n=1 Tax=Streptomyces mirabilis TaxID=68239 RepID=UPI003661D411
MSGPCPRPECGGQVHTDGWGTPIRCPRAMNVACAVLHTDAEGNRVPCPGYPHADAVTVPVHLTREEFFPLAAAIARREAMVRTGARILLPPFPDCPTCGANPVALEVADTRSITDDTVIFGFRRCGHTFAVTGEDLHLAYEQARMEGQ